MVEPVSEDVKAVERRRSVRRRCDMGITIEWGAAALEGRVSEISAEGMFVKLDAPLWIGARFAADLELAKSLRVECVVRRVQPRRGMAVTYTVQPGADPSTLASYFAHLDKLP